MIIATKELKPKKFPRLMIEPINGLIILAVKENIGGLLSGTVLYNGVSPNTAFGEYSNQFMAEHFIEYTGKLTLEND